MVSRRRRRARPQGEAAARGCPRPRDAKLEGGRPRPNPDRRRVRAGPARGAGRRRRARGWSAPARRRLRRARPRRRHRRRRPPRPSPRSARESRRFPRPNAASPLRPALAQVREAGRTGCPAGLGRGDPAPGAQHGVRAREFVGGRALVHLGVVQDKVFEMHQLALEPQAGAGVQEMRPADPPLPDRACAEALVEARQGVLGGRERARERRPGQRTGST